MTIRVSGAESRAAARRIATRHRQLAPGEDGGSPARTPTGAASSWRSARPGSARTGTRLAIRIGGCQVTRDGLAVPGYDEAPVARHMQGQEIEIEVDVGVGDGAATVWTCDLTHGYIDINADYRS